VRHSRISLDLTHGNHGCLRLARTEGSSTLRRHHHKSFRASFRAIALSRLFRAVAQMTDCFVACEPRRTRKSLLASHLVGVIGANTVTRRDAVLSVRAGFRDRELTACWPDHREWQLSETRAGLFRIPSPPHGRLTRDSEYDAIVVGAGQVAARPQFCLRRQGGQLR
jgi:hypothetical protein